MWIAFVLSFAVQKQGLTIGRLFELCKSKPFKQNFLMHIRMVSGHFNYSYDSNLDDRISLYLLLKRNQQRSQNV